MEKLTEQILDIIKKDSLGLVCPCGGGGLNDENKTCETCNGTGIYNWDFDYAMKQIDKAVKERDKYIIGGDHFIYEGATYKGNKKAVNLVKGSQRRRAEESR